MNNRFLNKVNGPEDLKQLKTHELVMLSNEIRQFIIDKVSVTGGHLGSNLGAVELTVALHYVFNSPLDKIVWDVGHQAYAHKIICGRKNQFHSLRKKDGLSGFLKTEESPHDIFNAGHSSTSISAALGLAKANELLKNDKSVIAVIGDGALTNGMAFEALNNLATLKSNMIIILNDNNMSISSNVGGMNLYLEKIRAGRLYNNVKKDVENVLLGIPKIGDKLFDKARSLKYGIKHLIRQGTIFEDLGVKYLGPVDGHDLPLMISLLESIKDYEGPVILHVHTIKGKGYNHAETRPDKYHGVSPFDIKTGLSAKKNPDTYSNRLGQVLAQQVNQNPKIRAITAAMTDGTGLNRFTEQFPQFIDDVGIAEEHAVTYAAGLAQAGFRPVVAIYSTFLQRSYDQIFHDVCLQNLPVLLAMDRGGLVGEDGETHQGILDISYLNHMPNMTLFAPSVGEDFDNAFDYWLQHNGPVAIRYPKGTIYQLPEQYPTLNKDVLKWQQLVQGEGIVILAVGPLLEIAIQVAEQLKQEGIDVGVMKCLCLKPLLDHNIKEICSQYPCIITMEENILAGGFGSELGRKIHQLGYSNQLICLGAEDPIVKQGSVDEQRVMLGIDANTLKTLIVSLTNKAPNERDENE